MSKTAEQFEAHQDVIVSTLSGVDAIGLAPEEQAAEATPVYEYMNTFDRLATRLFENFRQNVADEDKDKLPWAVINHGFLVTARGINQCAQSYQSYCEEQNHQYSLEELQQSLENPRTYRFFTAISLMNNAKNKAYELWVELTSGAFYESNFWFDEESKCFFPKEAILQHAEAESSLVGNADSDQEDYRVCPATRFIPMIWKSTVAACVEEGLLDQKELVASEQLEGME